MNDLSTIDRVVFPGSTVVFQRTTIGHTGWCAMAYEQGLPVASRTITEDQVREYMHKHDHFTTAI
jgi:hypothetical protein